MWEVTWKSDPRALELADRHYSRRKVGSKQFMPPGETLVLVRPGAVFGWWRPHPRSGIKAMNGRDGWTCTIFRNESTELSSTLILGAERALAAYTETCGPDGMMTYVDRFKVRGNNPGFCFKMAGWVHIGASIDGRKLLLAKPFQRSA